MKKFSDQIFEESLAGNVTKVMATWMTFRFANLIRKRFDEWEAYHHGIIDEYGHIIKIPRTAEERKSFGAFDNLVRKVKRAIVKFTGESKIFNTLIAIYLLKKESYSQDEHEIRIAIADELDNDEIMMLEHIILDMQNNYANQE